MDGKLYVFGIGGTGSRVLKSLVMLAAAGVKIDAKAIVPIIIDPDFANADVTRTIEQIKTYNKIRETLNFNDAVENGFFKTEFKTLSDSGKEYRLSIDDTKSRKFNEFVVIPYKPNCFISFIVVSQHRDLTVLVVIYQFSPEFWLFSILLTLPQFFLLKVWEKSTSTYSNLFQ